MSNIGFNDLARKYAKPGEDILAQMTPQKCHLDHMVKGVAGEAGELVDAIKRFTMYNKDLDRSNVVEELADLRFFMAGIMVDLEITEDELLEQENRKLGTRYSSGGYSDQQAQARADKQPVPSLEDMQKHRVVSAPAASGKFIEGLRDRNTYRAGITAALALAIDGMVPAKELRRLLVEDYHTVAK